MEHYIKSLDACVAREGHASSFIVFTDYIEKNTHTMTRNYSGGGIILVLSAMLLSAFYAILNWGQENWKIAAAASIAIAFFLIVVFFLKNRREGKGWFLSGGVAKNKFRKVSVQKEISNSKYWVGRPATLLVDSLGPPHAVDYQVLKNGIVETWIYCDQRSGLFTLNIIVENGTIVEWTAKSAEQSTNQ